eukprot:1188405-Prorocentrum_minimum.AAC.2
MVDVKGNRVDVKGNGVDVKGVSRQAARRRKRVEVAKAEVAETDRRVATSHESLVATLVRLHARSRRSHVMRMWLSIAMSGVFRGYATKVPAAEGSKKNLSPVWANIHRRGLRVTSTFSHGD